MTFLHLWGAAADQTKAFFRERALYLGPVDSSENHVGFKKRSVVFVELADRPEMLRGFPVQVDASNHFQVIGFLNRNLGSQDIFARCEIFHTI